VIAAGELLRRLIAVDTSNPPGNETPAAIVLHDFLDAGGVECELVARDPSRANLVARVRGGDGPTLAFLSHLDVVPVHRDGWSVDPFEGVVRDGAIWGRGAVDVKCHLASAAAALVQLERPPGDVLLIACADEENGEAKVGAEWLVQERPDIAADFVVGEGGGEKYGDAYTFVCGEKASCPVTVRVRGRAGDASIPGNGHNALVRAVPLVARLHEYEPERRVEPEVQLLLSAGIDHPAIELIERALVGISIEPTALEVPGPPNGIPPVAEISLNCTLPPSTTVDELLAELRKALGDGEYELEPSERSGGTKSPLETPLHRALESCVSELDPGSRLVPTLGYGYADCHWMREAFDSVAYGFVPFRSVDPMVNLTTKHGPDERILIDDLAFQVETHLWLARNLARYA
jgi:acetylornithine deacetylase/succinyl-diaminopimelate desuccinylase-like protein